MSERTSYAPGTPSWVDLGTPDIDAAAEFYGALLGWDVQESENPEQTGGYRQATLRGKSVAGIMPLMQEGQPPAWTTYISVANADVVAGKVSEAGGTTIAEPMDVLEFGRMAVFADPTGAVFAVWQPGTHIGAELVNEPGAFDWSELTTRDTAAAKAFYGDVFGWDFEDTDMGGMSYISIHLGGAPIGGMVDVTGRVPDEVPAHWVTYFAVEDTDAGLEKLEQLGGRKTFGPIDIQVGRLAVVNDPAGAEFALIQLSEQALASAG
jgi:predicted enzyme related to lactoylglutathione lyase